MYMYMCRYMYVYVCIYITRARYISLHAGNVHTQVAIWRLICICTLIHIQTRVEMHNYHSHTHPLGKPNTLLTYTSVYIYARGERTIQCLYIHGPSRYVINHVRTIYQCVEYGIDHGAPFDVFEQGISHGTPTHPHIDHEHIIQYGYICIYIYTQL